ncbi:peptide chain release factor 1 [Rickettsia typhi]|uniref:Peptide chain release factor 1 n=2 Tax=Rickettsia typhi TaxID=785 RepID=RF1_RICTY|nr:peptide chain release factor 1 [Rickettsia typhi]Q68WK7.1 RecName: Full=Peptide chain release factor 1; Short=RF-1 [Rickettsia typhi str. Wilmington]AAU03985.1 peptide chain release factor 1 (RF-1) [Rickettsia typhi str. Wilmington]AFE54365.1 peptide chain release factor 1 [Rickettsia typhi str. TH1527]AFE55203.1 peptide chain release factor 1 [Rickettsia typhi str. B9991CWPP]
MSFSDNLVKILDKYENLGRKLSSGIIGDEFVKASKEYAELEDIVVKIKEYNKVKSELEEANNLRLEVALDNATLEMINNEIYILENLLPKLERAVRISLLPKDEADSKSAIIEVRAGSGGEEAALFAAVLFNMYQRYAEFKGWRFEILAISNTGIGGYKEASASIKGKDVFSKLKFESGVHRVQRVPETESQGRIHTSAATVAVLPEAEGVDIKIEDKDLRIDTYRSSGAGGQHVNTTDSAVRITHIPTGITVALQDEKSQHKNKAKALKILRARLYEEKRRQKEQERSDSRRWQVGSGDRSERIRTYNFLHGRVSDHRINLTLYKIDEVVKHGQLDEFIEALIANDEAKKLSEL